MSFNLSVKKPTTLKTSSNVNNQNIPEEIDITPIKESQEKEEEFPVLSLFMVFFAMLLSGTIFFAVFQFVMIMTDFSFEKGAQSASISSESLPKEPDLGKFMIPSELSAALKAHKDPDCLQDKLEDLIVLESSSITKQLLDEAASKCDIEFTSERKEALYQKHMELQLNALNQTLIQQ